MLSYGCPLWDYTSKVIDKFYLAWRKPIPRILNLPQTTHCVLLNQICADMPVRDQLYIRFINFYKSLLNSGNKITQTCANWHCMAATVLWVTILLLFLIIYPN